MHKETNTFVHPAHICSLRTHTIADALKYASNRQAALSVVMIAVALTTMPRHEATLRGSAASPGAASAAEAALATAASQAAAAEAATGITTAISDSGTKMVEAGGITE